MTDDRPDDDDDDDVPEDPRPSGRIRIVGAKPATGEHPTVPSEPPSAPEAGEPPPAAEDPNRFGAIPIISADEPPPEEGEPSPPPEPVRVTPTAVPDLGDLDLPPTAAVPTVADQDEDDLDDIRVWAAPDDDEPDLGTVAGRTAPDDRFDELVDAALDLGGGGNDDDDPTETEMPHWTEPPSGQVAAVSGDEDLDVWSGVSSGPRWRGQGEESGQPEDFSDLKDERRVEPDLDVEDDVVFDDLGVERPETAEPAAGPPQRRAAYPDAPADEEGPSGGGPRDMQQAVVVGVGLVVLMVVCFLIGPGATVLLATLIVVMATAEFFTATRRAGYHPAPLVGLVGSGAMVLAAYWRGEAAIPLVMVLVVITALAWWLLDLGGEHAVANISITVFGVMYIGGLGSFAAILLKFPDGIGMLFGAILVAVAADVGGLFVGQRMGRSPLPTSASPNKTVEGIVGGFLAAIVAAVVVLGIIGVFPWEFSDALALGAVGGLVAPLGDLCESRLKRDLGVKDMGQLLPGHGGVLDRFDGLLFVLPATYYLIRLLEVWANVPS
jgi:phosphatidate cytidylyltransferase